ncbi:MAG TPA: amidohydrolase family protein [Terriglobales bacterium]
MKRLAWLLLIATFAFLVAAAAGIRHPETAAASPQPASTTFSAHELRAFTALEPIDTHTHVFQSDPAFFILLQRLHLHILDICVVDRHSKFQAHLQPQLDAALGVVHSSGGQAALCTTFDPYPFSQPGFAAAVIRQINGNFEQGAIALKIWKNIGMELQDAKGNYVLPDNPVFSSIYQDIAAHHKTLIAHVADPDSLWNPPDPASPDYSYYMEHPEWYMYKKPHPASKEAILQARDHLLEENPNLRVVGAHLGSMESDFDELSRHLDHYSNFAVDLAARMPYVMKAPRAKMIAFITKYQDRLLYATDLGFSPGQDPAKVVKEWEETYARDWRFFATGESVDENNHNVEGLSLPESVLRKLYHDNAIRWFPGIVASAD